MEMILNTVRMVDYDQVREYAFGDENSLKENLAIGFIHPEDFNKLNLTPSLNLKLSNNNGEVVISVKKNDNISPGTILMPISIWANQLTSIKNTVLIFKNIIIEAEATNEPILEIKSLLETIKR
ncbi:MAG: molybdopterin dinucleotide binding domain-containing protein [Candidatus Hermodarchaeota archaeon]